MKIEDIIIGEEYFVDLNHTKAYCAFSDDVNTDIPQIVKVIRIGENFHDESDYIVEMKNMEHQQIIGIECFIKLV